jgi:hypothetical protein
MIRNGIKVVFLLFFFCVIACKNKKLLFSTKEYLPIGLNDTLIYRYISGNQSGLDTVMIATIKRDDYTAFLFGSPENIKGRSLIYTTHFNPGLLYYNKKGDLYAALVRHKIDLDSVMAKDFKKLFPKRINVGYSTTFVSSDKSRKLTYRFISMENVKTPTAMFENCLKLQIERYWPYYKSTDTSYVWLKKDIGVVKWIRNTGRVEELISKPGNK